MLADLPRYLFRAGSRQNNTKCPLDWSEQFDFLDGFRRVAIHHPESLPFGSPLVNVLRVLLFDLRSQRASLARQSMAAAADLFTTPPLSQALVWEASQTPKVLRVGGSAASSPNNSDSLSLLVADISGTLLGVMSP